MEIYQEKQTGLATGATELISVADAKSWAVIDTDLDDSVITSIIVSAREMVESFISKDLVSKDREVFADAPEYDGEKYLIHLTYPAKTGTVVVTSGTTTLSTPANYKLTGINGNIIELTGSHTDVTITYESNPIVSASELDLAASAVKVLVEQIYDNRGNLEGDSDIVVMDMNVKTILAPIRTVYL